MNVIVANDQQNALTNLDVDIIKSITGSYDVSEIIEMFKGSTCGIKETSCVDQLTQCLEEALTHLATRS